MENTAAAPERFTHDRLQQECHRHLSDNYPDLIKLYWAVNNETKPFPGETKKAHAIRINRLKAIGQVRGVYDYHFYFRRRLYVFDFKVGKDVESDHQRRFAAQIELQGGKAYIINDTGQFKAAIKEIICTPGT